MRRIFSFLPSDDDDCCSKSSPWTRLWKTGTLKHGINVETSQNDVLLDVEESCVVDRITTSKCNTVVASSTKFAKAKKIVMPQSSRLVASRRSISQLIKYYFKVPCQANKKKADGMMLAATYPLFRSAW
jgi:hypothetical protein